jgi:5-methylcytosine-specific restriction enzyme subunit McrC
MVSAAHLAFSLALPTENAGKRLLAQPDREITWVRKLYEKAVAGFYDVVLIGDGWHTRAGQTIRWPTGKGSPCIDDILPSMITDIVLTNYGSEKRIVIDTKFNSILTSGRFREKSLRSGYIYQIYAYLRSQEGQDDPLWDNASGLLLHPAINCMMDEFVEIQGHEIRFTTVNLSASAVEIRNQLLRAVGLSGVSLDSVAT